MKTFMLLIGEYYYLFLIGFAVVCIIVAYIILRNEEKSVEKSKKVRYNIPRTPNGMYIKD